MLKIMKSQHVNDLSEYVEVLVISHPKEINIFASQLDKSNDNIKKLIIISS